MQLDQRSEVISEVLKAAPAVAVAAPNLLFGMTVNDVLALVTIVYVAFQIGYLLHRWWRMAHRPNRPTKDDED